MRHIKLTLAAFDGNFSSASLFINGELGSPLLDPCKTLQNKDRPQSELTLPVVAGLGHDHV
jgi:hypothetical protein